VLSSLLIPTGAHLLILVTWKNDILFWLLILRFDEEWARCRFFITHKFLLYKSLRAIVGLKWGAK